MKSRMPMPCPLHVRWGHCTEPAVYHDRSVRNARLLNMLKHMQFPTHLAILPDATLETKTCSGWDRCCCIYVVTHRKVLLQISSACRHVITVIPMTTRGHIKDMLAYVSGCGVWSWVHNVYTAVPLACPVCVVQSFRQLEFR